MVQPQNTVLVCTLERIAATVKLGTYVSACMCAKRQYAIISNMVHTDHMFFFVSLAQNWHQSRSLVHLSQRADLII